MFLLIAVCLLRAHTLASSDNNINVELHLTPDDYVPLIKHTTDDQLIINMNMLKELINFTPQRLQHAIDQGVCYVDVFCTILPAHRTRQQCKNFSWR